MACESPITLRLTNPKYDYYDTGKKIDSIPLNCGKCYSCIKRRIAQWCFRLKQEEKISISAKFVTLTYDTEHVPLTERYNMTLKKKDLTDFFKRLRYYHQQHTEIQASEVKYIKQHNKRPDYKAIKYYACGEYGEQYGRPHYHIILFNTTDECIKAAWTLGKIHIGDVTEESIAYVLKYIEKTDDNKTNDPDVIKKYGVNSKGLGANYVNEEIIAWHKADPNRNYMQDKHFKIALSRIYRNQIYSPEERDVLLGYVKAKVEEAEEKQQQKDIRNGFDPAYMELSRKRAKRDKLNKRIKKRDFKQ